MRILWTLLLIAVVAAVCGLVVWMLNLDDLIRESIRTGHLLDWVMGAVCFIWLILILKMPWDLYFHAREVDFELQRSKERQIAVIPGREEYLRVLRQRLGWFAVGMHLLSAGLIAAVSYFSGRAVGYYFAAFYLISTAFRPAAAFYHYLRSKLFALAEEVRYPREDVVELRGTVEAHKWQLEQIQETLQQIEKRLEQEQNERQREVRELHQHLSAVSRELETVVSSLTDNQEVIKGIQAFVRFITQAAARS